MITQFAVTVMYTQITVAAIGTPPTALDWTDAQVAQGFSWSPTSVAFGVPDHDGEVLLQVDRAATPSIDAQTLWAVQVPFDVPPASVEIGTILLERPVAVPPGRYNLVFEALPAARVDGHDYTYVIRLIFCPSPAPEFKILKQGTELKTDKVLRTKDDPAG